MNWKAFAIVGGSALLVFLLILTPLLIYWHYRDKKRGDGGEGGALTKTGVVLLLLPALLLLVWKILSATALSRYSSVVRLLFGLFVLIVFFGSARLYDSLEKRGVRFLKRSKGHEGA